MDQVIIQSEGEPMKTIIPFLVFVSLLLFVLACPAQAANITFQWDASSSPDATPENPIRYWLYTCTDSALTTCTQNDAGTNLTISVPLTSGKYWSYCTARLYSTVIDGVPSGALNESGKSNVVQFQLTVPPGNPGNFRIKLNP